MCIAIVKPEGTEIKDETLRACFQSNPDGAGIAFAKDGKLYYLKGIFNEDDFVEKVRKYEKEAQGAMLIHCRIGTSGLKDAENCHPHVVNEHCVMIHNGILDVDVPKGSRVSDTVIYTEQCLRQLPDRFMDYPQIIRMISNDIGSNNKICFLNEKGEYAIANEQEGEWEDGIWYSNDNYKWNFRWGSYNQWDDYYDSVDRETKKMIENRILSLSYDELLRLGRFPLVNVYTGELRKDKNKYRRRKEYIYLDEASTQLSELLEELQDEAKEYTDKIMKDVI